MSNQKQPDRARLLRHLGLSGFVLLLLLSPLVFELIAQGHNAPLHAELEGLTQASLEQCELDDAVMADLQQQKKGAKAKARGKGERVRPKAKAKAAAAEAAARKGKAPKKHTLD